MVIWWLYFLNSLKMKTDFLVSRLEWWRNSEKIRTPLQKDWNPDPSKHPAGQVLYLHRPNPSPSRTPFHVLKTAPNTNCVSKTTSIFKTATRERSQSTDCWIPTDQKLNASPPLLQIFCEGNWKFPNPTAVHKRKRVVIIEDLPCVSLVLHFHTI